MGHAAVFFCKVASGNHIELIPEYVSTLEVISAILMLFFIIPFYNAISHSVIKWDYFLDWYKFYKFLCRPWDYLE
jgi:hypothetical protein